MSRQLDRWIPIVEAAKLAGVSPKVMRARMHYINERCGGRAMVSYTRSGKPGKFFVSVEALHAYMSTDPDQRDRELSSMAARCARIEGRMEALRTRHVALANEVKLWKSKCGELEARVDALLAGAQLQATGSDS